MDRDTYGGECGGTSPSPPNPNCDIGKQAATPGHPANAFAREYDARFTEQDRLRGGPSTLRNQVENAHRLTAKQALFQEASRLRQEAAGLEQLAMTILDSLPILAPEADAVLWTLVQRRR